MSIQIVQHLAVEQWRSFVNHHPDGNIFHSPEMFQVFQRAQGHQPSLWAATDGQNRLLALLLPVKVTVIDGLLAPMTARSVVYGGALCEPSPEGQAALDRLLVTYNRSGAKGSLFTEVRNLADAELLQVILQQHGYTYEAYQNFLIDLSLPKEEVWHNVSKSARKKIRRALHSEQMTVEEIQERQRIASWYALLQETYHRIQVPLADPSLFYAAFDILYPERMIQFLLGRVGGVAVAASVALLYKNTMYGWYRGFDRAYSSYLPNDLMVWHALEWGAENGYKVFDFGGAGKADEDYGPRQFKAKFGGELVEFGRNIHVPSRLRLRLSEAGYAFYRRFL